MTERDTARAVVYAAEDQWSAALDRGGAIDFFGSKLTLPQQREFETIDDMQSYCDGVMSNERVMSRYPSAGSVVVRARAGQRSAHYESVGHTIAIPLSGTAGEPSWACCEAVLLHELTHHLLFSAADPAAVAVAIHGSAFTTSMCWLVCEVLGSEAALVLQGAFQGAGVTVGAYVD